MVRQRRERVRKEGGKEEERQAGRQAGSEGEARQAREETSRPSGGEPV